MDLLDPNIIQTFLNNNPVYQDIQEFSNSQFQITDTELKFLDRVGVSNILLWYHLNIGTSISATENELTDYLNFLDKYGYSILQFFLVLLYYSLEVNDSMTLEVQMKFEQLLIDFYFHQNDYNQILIAAAQNGYLEIVKFAIKNGADIHAEDNFDLELSAGNDAALRWSAKYGHLEVVKYLIQQGADLHAENDHALRWSAENGHLEVVKYLISQGADIHVDDNFILKSSAKIGNLELLKYLEDQGADIHANDEELLRLSAGNNRLNIVKYLVSRGANIYAWWNGALIESMGNNHPEIIKYLIDLDPNLYSVFIRYIKQHPTNKRIQNLLQIFD